MRSVSFFQSPRTGGPVEREFAADSPTAGMQSSEESPSPKRRKHVASRGAPSDAVDTPPVPQSPRSVSERLRPGRYGAMTQEGGAGDESRDDSIEVSKASVAERPDNAQCLLLASNCKAVAIGRLVKSTVDFHGIRADPDCVVVSVCAVKDPLCRYPMQGRYRMPGRRRTVWRLGDLAGIDIVWSLASIEILE